MYYLMPAIHFNPVKENPFKPTDYKCPTYKTNVRAGVLSTTG